MDKPFAPSPLNPPLQTITLLELESVYPGFASQVQADVAKAIAEDVGTGDLSAQLVPDTALARAKIITRETAVVCGRPWVEATLEALAPQAEVQWHAQEGQRCEADSVVLECQGPARQLLSAERVMLNFLQLLSGVATTTAAYVEQVKGTKARILDTRKTLPGLRLAQKYAVRMGGGHNHRMGLYDAILIKENHIAALGGVAQALAFAKASIQIPEVKDGQQPITPRFIQIEVENLKQLEEALEAGANLVLLDNMSLPLLQEAVRLNAGRAELEVSGGVSLENVRDLALTGVDRISIGRLTKDVRAIDFSMRFEA